MENQMPKVIEKDNRIDFYCSWVDIYYNQKKKIGTIILIYKLTKNYKYCHKFYAE